jgi:uncharacterized protein YggE
MTKIRTLMAVVLLHAPLALAGQNTGIHVSGSGSVEVEPDMGTVALHARREGEGADALKADLDQVVRAVIALSRRLSIEPRDVTATAVSIQPRYRRRDNETVVDGLVATRTVSIVLRDLTRFGDLLDGALAAGINNADPIRLDSSRRSELEDEALRLAMTDAQREAALVADGFGLALGAPTDVQVGAHSPRPQEFARAASFAMADAAPDFSAGLILIERAIQVTFAIDGDGQ